VVKAIWNGEVIAESGSTVMVEGNHYFPRSAVRQDVLTDSTYSTVCPWKGTASYHSVVVNGQTNQDAAWYYAEPKQAASQIKDYLAFWRGVTIEE
jgi:uncharacterized protein (DUF427 family)